MPYRGRTRKLYYWCLFFLSGLAISVISHPVLQWYTFSSFISVNFFHNFVNVGSSFFILCHILFNITIFTERFSSALWIRMKNNFLKFPLYISAMHYCRWECNIGTYYIRAYMMKDKTFWNFYNLFNKLLFFRLKNPAYIVNAFNVDPLYLKHDQQGEAPDYRVYFLFHINDRIRMFSIIMYFWILVFWKVIVNIFKNLFSVIIFTVHPTSTLLSRIGNVGGSGGVW